jgi:hypothetical protein
MSRFLAPFLLAVMLLPVTSHAQTKSGSDSVFVDEGDSDFEDVPTDMTFGGSEASAVPIAPVQKSVKAKKPTEPAPVVENWEDNDTAATPKAKDVYDQMADSAVLPEVKKEKPKAEKKHHSIARETAKTSDEPTDAVENVNLPHKKGKKGPRPASLAGAEKNFKNYGFKTTNHPCAMRAEPSETAAEILTVKENRRLWLERAGTDWYKGYHHNGSGFISANCFQ